jgi:meso-butanediol dehydrogenase/(S,S)-butanediol dehydrogenase/diacetyl reductase
MFKTAKQHGGQRHRSHAYGGFMSEFAGKSVVVTGGASGIGAAIARVFHDEGARVTILDLDRVRAAALAAELGENVFSGHIDVRERTSVQLAIDEVISKRGGIDILCANAGVSTMQASVDLTDEDWDFNMDVNAKGVFLCNQIVVRHFLATGGKGVIVNTASLAGKVGAPLLAHYSASKFAVLGWTQALARELAPTGIRVNAVCPGFVRTGMQEREIIWEGKLRGMTPDAVREEYVTLTPMGRIEEPEDVAVVVRFLASDGARFMTGQGINVTGGVRMD